MNNNKSTVLVPIFVYNEYGNYFWINIEQICQNIIIYLTVPLRRYR